MLHASRQGSITGHRRTVLRDGGLGQPGVVDYDSWPVSNRAAGEICAGAGVLGCLVGWLRLASATLLARQVLTLPCLVQAIMSAKPIVRAAVPSRPTSNTVRSPVQWAVDWSIGASTRTDPGCDPVAVTPKTNACMLRPHRLGTQPSMSRASTD